MKISTPKRITIGLSAALFLFTTIIGTLITSSSASAASAAGFRPGRIIDNTVFTNYRSMSAQQIQNFLNGKVPHCDTNGTQPYGSTTRAQYAKSRGVNPPFTCLRNYTQNNQTAARIIYNAAQEFKINPQVLLVLLQKEQGLITDDWPWPIQYRSATGYGCPDSAPCDSQYYGLTNQVRWAARMFRAIMNNSSTWYTPYVLGNNHIYWHPDTGRCGGSTVNIENRATVALYSYTPYRPNQAALNAGYGTGNSCSSYGNRNFYLYYKDWFGSPHSNTPYAWTYQSRGTYLDQAHSQPFKNNIINVAPGGKAYIRTVVRNAGYAAWEQSFLNLGTWGPQDRTSVFSEASWLNNKRPTRLLESSVPSGETGTFDFAITAPAQVGTYVERFNVVAEGRTWMRDQGLNFIINVANPISAQSTDHTLSAGETLTPNNHLQSQALHSVLRMQSDGNFVLYNDFEPEWWSATNGKKVKHLIMQSDGNLVLYGQNDAPLWHTGTSGNPNSRLSIQTDGNMVLYNQSNQPLWSTQTVNRPNGLAYVNTTLRPGVMHKGQRIETADRRYKFVFQNDGNIVLYSPNRAIWSTKTNGKHGTRLVMQNDGNLVLYRDDNGVVWSTRTGGRIPASLTVQGDGNLVLYDRNSRPVWHTRTNGLQ